MMISIKKKKSEIETGKERTVQSKNASLWRVTFVLRAQWLKEGGCPRPGRRAFKEKGIGVIKVLRYRNHYWKEEKYI